MFRRIAILLSLFSLATVFSCSKPIKQGDWIDITFMDVRNVTFKVSVKLTGAVFDNESRFLRVNGVVKNRMNEYREFNIRNWVYRINDSGMFLKPHSVGLPVVPLAAANPKVSVREETFELIYRIDQPGTLSEITLVYADQFMMTGKINKTLASVKLQVTSGTVSYRG
ncbi:MAG TPA: hypothetical protein VHO70_18250 [Chitinispirillaceae bacterium]|nr:hypothetical protein [Chitinispirillaceae bacterium]